MTKVNVPKFLKTLGRSVSKRSPEILTGIGIAGMITTTVLAVRATPKAMMLMEDAEHEKQETLTAKEKIKAAWKPYIPAIVTGVTSTVCLVGACSVNTRRTAAIATAYKLSEAALSEYKDKVIETLGEEKEKVVREKVTEEKVKKNPVTKNEVIITDKGNALCYDALSGRYFKSDIEQIKRAVNEVNRVMLNEMYVSLNDFYDELGLDHIELGDQLGWNIDDKLIEVDFSSHLADDGTPCLAINYGVAPKYGYYKLV